MKKNCFKYKGMLKKKSGLRADGASTSGKQSNQADIVKEAAEEPCDVLSVNLGRDKGWFSDARLLDSECLIPHVHKEWFSIYEPFEGGTVLMKNDVACKILE